METDCSGLGLAQAEGIIKPDWHETGNYGEPCGGNSDLQDSGAGGYGAGRAEGFGCFKERGSGGPGDRLRYGGGCGRRNFGKAVGP